jgi:hypothetical protein
MQSAINFSISEKQIPASGIDLHSTFEALKSEGR